METMQDMLKRAHEEEEAQIRAEEEADAELAEAARRAGAELTARLGLKAQAAIPTVADEPAKIVLMSKAGKSLRFDLSEMPCRPEDDLAVGSLEMDLDFEEDDELPMMKTMSLPLRPPPGLHAPPSTSKLPSVGSAGHAAGNCQPCAWFWKPGSCHNGQACVRCHLCLEGELKSRKSVKKTMLRLGLIQSTFPQLQVDLQEAPSSMMEGGESTSCSGSELESLVTNSSADMGTSSMTPLGMPKYQSSHKWLGVAGIPRNDCGLSITPVFETTNLSAGPFHQECISSNTPLYDATKSSAGADEDKEEDDDDGELSMVHSLSLRAPPGLTSPEQAGSETASASLLHEMGACQPCGWFWKPGGCKNGAECLRCHACPVGELKARKKAKRTMMRLGLITPKADANTPSAMTAPSRFEADFVSAQRLRL